jgi:hypothetical protein
MEEEREKNGPIHAPAQTISKKKTPTSTHKERKKKRCM